MKQQTKVFKQVILFVSVFSKMDPCDVYMPKGCEISCFAHRKDARKLFVSSDVQRTEPFDVHVFDALREEL